MKAPAVVGREHVPRHPRERSEAPVERLHQMRHVALGRQVEDHRVRRELFRQVAAAVD